MAKVLLEFIGFILSMKTQRLAAANPQMTSTA